jgi:hypothetical protein
MYTDNSIFQDQRVNSINDMLWEKADEYGRLESTDIDLSTVMCLSGMAAKILQGGDPEPVKNIIHVTNSEEIFKWISENVRSFLLPQQVLRFTNKLIIVYPFMIMEIHYMPGSLTIITQDGIRVQDSDTIPEELL